MARASSLSILIRLCLTINYVSLCHIVLMLTDGGGVSGRVGRADGLFTCTLLFYTNIYSSVQSRNALLCIFCRYRMQQMLQLIP